MIKKLNYKQVLIDILENSFSHIYSINKEIKNLNIKDPKDCSSEVQQKLRSLTMTLTLINDLIHPGHKISKIMLAKTHGPLIDYCIKAQRAAIESELVDECFCNSCKEDKNGIKS